jgi:hypothetical protein
MQSSLVNKIELFGDTLSQCITAGIHAGWKGGVVFAIVDQVAYRGAHMTEAPFPLVDILGAMYGFVFAAFVSLVAGIVVGIETSAFSVPLIDVRRYRRAVTTQLLIVAISTVLVVLRDIMPVFGRTLPWTMTALFAALSVISALWASGRVVRWYVGHWETLSARLAGEAAPQGQEARP